MAHASVELLDSEGLAVDLEPRPDMRIIIDPVSNRHEMVSILQKCVTKADGLLA